MDEVSSSLTLEEVASYLQELSDYIRKLLECPSVFEEVNDDDA